jgi:hypothetical protein
MRNGASCPTVSMAPVLAMTTLVTGPNRIPIPPRRTGMKTDKKLWRNRKTRKELARRLQSENPGLEIVHPHAAGIDVDNSAHYVAGAARL